MHTLIYTSKIYLKNINKHEYLYFVVKFLEILTPVLNRITHTEQWSAGIVDSAIWKDSGSENYNR